MSSVVFPPRILIAIAIAALFALALPGRAPAADKPRTVSVTGIGTAKARPDTAHITIGVVSEGETARAALDQNTAAMRKVVAELEAQGLADADIQTVNFSVHPKFEHPDDGKPPVIVGYRVVNSVRITVRDRDKLGAILDTAVSLGSNQIGGIEFSIAEASALEDQARRDAMADARRKAQLYAATANAALGRALTISEETSTPPRPMLARAAEAKTAVAIEAGEYTLQVRVQVSWELQ